MDTADIRREVLRTIIDREFDGVARRLASHVQKPDGQINDMLATPPRKSFGEKIARYIESQCGLARGYLDDPGNIAGAGDQAPATAVNEPVAQYVKQPRLSREALNFAAYYDMLPGEKKAEFEAALAGIVLSLPVEKRTELAKIIDLFR